MDPRSSSVEQLKATLSEVRSLKFESKDQPDSIELQKAFDRLLNAVQRTEIKDDKAAQALIGLFEFIKENKGITLIYQSDYDRNSDKYNKFLDSVTHLPDVHYWAVEFSYYYDLQRAPKLFTKHRTALDLISTRAGDKLYKLLEKIPTTNPYYLQAKEFVDIAKKRAQYFYKENTTQLLSSFLLWLILKLENQSSDMPYPLDAQSETILFEDNVGKLTQFKRIIPQLVAVIASPAAEFAADEKGVDRDHKSQPKQSETSQAIKERIDNSLKDIKPIGNLNETQLNTIRDNLAALISNVCGPSTEDDTKALENYATNIVDISTIEAIKKDSSFNKVMVQIVKTLDSADLFDFTKKLLKKFPNKSGSLKIKNALRGGEHLNQILKFFYRECAERAGFNMTIDEKSSPSTTDSENLQKMKVLNELVVQCFREEQAQNLVGISDPTKVAAQAIYSCLVFDREMKRIAELPTEDERMKGLMGLSNIKVVPDAVVERFNQSLSPEFRSVNSSVPIVDKLPASPPPATPSRWRRALNYVKANPWETLAFGLLGFVVGGAVVTAIVFTGGVALAAIGGVTGLSAISGGTGVLAAVGGGSATTGLITLAVSSGVVIGVSSATANAVTSTPPPRPKSTRAVINGGTQAELQKGPIGQQEKRKITAATTAQLPADSVASSLSSKNSPSPNASPVDPSSPSASPADTTRPGGNRQ